MCHLCLILSLFQPIPFHFPKQGTPGNPQGLGRMNPMPAVLLKGFHKKIFLKTLQGLIQGKSIGDGFFFRRSNFSTPARKIDLLEGHITAKDVLQLPDISRPVVIVKGLDIP